jgi:hypothetical protein
VRRLPDGTFAQCKRAASWQLGSPVCGVHGGGWPVRVAHGERKNPVTASFAHGNRSRYNTILVANYDPNLDKRVARAAWVFAELKRITANIQVRAREIIARDKAERGRRRRFRPTRAQTIENRRQWFDRILEESRTLKRS